MSDFGNTCRVCPALVKLDDTLYNVQYCTNNESFAFDYKFTDLLMCPIPNVGITDHIWRNKTVKGSVLYFFRRTNKTPPEHVHFNCLYRNLLWKTPKFEYRQFSCYIPKMLFIKEERVYPLLYLEMFLLK